jgi:hypothetical protein
MPYPGWPHAQVTGCQYEDALFTGFVQHAILSHPKPHENGLFVFWAPHVIHTPLEVRSHFIDCRMIHHI